MVGNVTMLQTWTNAAPEASRSPRIIYCVGQGVITTADVFFHTADVFRCT